MSAPSKQSNARAGHRVGLRDWRDDDLAPLRAWLDPAHRWHETNGPYFTRMTSSDIDAFVARIAGWIGSDLPVPRTSMAIADPDDRMIGQVSWYWESEETDWRRMGVVIYDDSLWGRLRHRGARLVDFVPVRHDGRIAPRLCHLLRATRR